MTDRPVNARDHWKSRSAGWSLTAATAEPRDDYFDQALIKAAGIRPGHHVLDLAAGTGDPAVSIARNFHRAGSGAVTAVDLTFEMLNMAKQRVEFLKFGGVDFTIADMGSLPFEDDRFDAGTCRLGLMFPEDKAACAAEARRVLKPGATMAYLCWAAIDENPAFKMFARAAETYFGGEFPLRMVRHALGEPGSIAGILDQAGFGGVAERPVTYDRVVETGDSYFRNGIARAWPDRVENLQDAEWDELLRITEDHFEPLKKDGKFRIPQCANLGTGVVNG